MKFKSFSVPATRINSPAIKLKYNHRKSFILLLSLLLLLLHLRLIYLFNITELRLLNIL